MPLATWSLREGGVFSPAISHKRAAQERIRGRFPVAEPRGPREAVIHRPLIRVAQLVGLERVAVDDPAAVQVVSDRRQGCSCNRRRCRSSG